MQRKHWLCANNILSESFSAYWDVAKSRGDGGAEKKIGFEDEFTENYIIKTEI